MKKIPFLLSLIFLVGCSQFKDNVEPPKTIATHLEIETKLPVINIVVEQAAFDEMYENIDEEIEVEARFNLYRNHAHLIKDEEIEIEIKGGFSTRYSLKTLGIKFEDKYNNEDRSLINPDKILPFHNLDKIKAIRLRNSGNDFENTMLKDLSFTQMAINAELDIDVTYGEASLVYVNGDFYGLMNIRTEGNTNGIAGLYEAKKKDVTLAKITTHELIKKDGDFARIDALVAAVENNDIEHLKNEIDLSSFIDYMVYESYLGNTDWPHNNSRFYAIDGGKFRFVLFDLDKVAWLKMDRSPLFIIEDEGYEDAVIPKIFFTLFEDESFKKDFWYRYRELMDSGLLSLNQLRSIVDANAENIRSEMELQIEEHNAPNAIIEWNIELDKILVLFKEREQVVRDFLETQ